MERNLAEQDWTELGRHTHDLKSDSGNLGARVLSALRDNCRPRRAGDGARCIALMPRLVAASEDARVALADARGREHS